VEELLDMELEPDKKKKSNEFHVEKQKEGSI